LLVEHQHRELAGLFSFRRGAIDTRRLELAAAALGWVAVFALISALIADAFR
jgi:hypothetical protein